MKTTTRTMQRLRSTRSGHGRRRRRGSLYVAVLMVGALVSVLGMSALLVSRVTQQAHTGLSDAVAARMNAHAAIRLAMLEIEDNPDWRFTYTDSEWYRDRPLGNGSFCLTVVDPSDNDLTDAAADPILLTGVGRQGQAVHRTEITLAPLHRGYDCLSSAVHSGDDVRFFDAQARSDHRVTANDDLSASNSYVTGLCSAVDRITGSVFADATTAGAESLSLPLPADVFDFYLEQGTWIDPAALPNQFASIVRNGGFETGDTFWQARDAVLTVDSSVASEGNACLQVTRRVSEAAGVCQDVRPLLMSGRNYTVELAVRVEDMDTTLYAHLLIEDDNGTSNFVSAPIAPGIPKDWTNISVNLQPVFDSSVRSAILLINSDSDMLTAADPPAAAPATFWIDSVVLRETGSVRNFDQVLLSPQHNPFGDVNERGIYLLDMNSRPLIIRNSRIYGTLVIIDPADRSLLGDDQPLWMSPSVPGYPALLISGGRCDINPSDRGLSESALQTNLNPPGAPFDQLGADDDLDDVYASGIDGLIYSTDRLRLKNLQMTGVVVSDNDVHISGEFSIRYDNRYFRSPPPGFSGPEQIRILLGSARRTAQ